MRRCTPSLLVVLIVLALGGLHACRRQAVPSFQVLEGKWERPDGGYVIAIAKVTGSGGLEASYFNPGPIHVEKAVTSRDATGLHLTVVLRDANYPGSTYTLTYDPSDDRLKGTYYQAVAQETYQVVFARLAP